MGAITWAGLLSLSSDPLALLLLLPILLLSSYFYVNAATWRSYGGKRLPPGSFGFPLGLGENLQFLIGNTGAMGTPRPFLSARHRKYGSIFRTHLLGHPTVVSMDADLNKLVLSSEENLVQSAYPQYVRRMLGKLMDIRGDRHLQMRELFRNSLSPTAIQSLHFFPLQEHTRHFLTSWSNKDIIDVQEESNKFVISYTLKFLLNLSLEDPNALPLINDCHIISAYHSSVPLNIPGLTYNRALKARKRIYTIVGELVNARRKVMGEKVEYFMDTMIQEAKKPNTFLDEEGLVEILMGLVAGSLDTSSILLTSVIKLLSENPQVLDELLKENMLIRKNKKENELLDWEDFKQLQFTKFVIKETLRIANIAEFLPREVLRDIVYKDMIIPKGWRILINFSMLHLNPSHYENPLKFNPWRWKDMENINESFFKPFGGGIKFCLGSFLIEMEVMLFIHYLITTYKWHRLTNTDGQRGVVSGHFVSKLKLGIPIKIAPLKNI